MAINKQFDTVSDIRQQVISDLLRSGIIAGLGDIIVVPVNPPMGIYDIRYRPGVQVQIDSMDLHVADTLRDIAGSAL